MVCTLARRSGGLQAGRGASLQLRSGETDGAITVVYSISIGVRSRSFVRLTSPLHRTDPAPRVTRNPTDARRSQMNLQLHARTFDIAHFHYCFLILPRIFVRMTPLYLTLGLITFCMSFSSTLSRHHGYAACYDKPRRGRQVAVTSRQPAAPGSGPVLTRHTIHLTRCPSLLASRYAF